MWTRRLMLSLLGLCVAGPAVAQRSAEPPLGATLRWSEAGRLQQGTLVAPAQADAPYRVAVRGTRDTLLIPRITRELAWKAHGSLKLLGAAIGFGGGMVLGYAVGAEASADCSGWCFEEVTKMMTATLGGVVGTVAGVLLAPGAQWIPVGSDVRLGLVLGTGRVGIRASR